MAKILKLMDLAVGVLVDNFYLGILALDWKEPGIHEQLMRRVRSNKKAWEVRPNHVRDILHFAEEAKQLYTMYVTYPRNNVVSSLIRCDMMENEM